MYAESVGVPLIIRGPDVEQGRVETAAVSHIDIYNTVLNSVGIPAEQGTASARSQSLLGKLSPDRVVMSERSEEHTSELQSLMRISYAVFCLKKKNNKTKQ